MAASNICTITLLFTSLPLTTLASGDDTACSSSAGASPPFMSSDRDYSCDGRCGRSPGKVDVCSCDGLCSLFKDCCPDFATACSDLAVPKSRPRPEHISCIKNPNSVDGERPMSAVIHCPVGWKDDIIRTKCQNVPEKLQRIEDIILLTPVTDSVEKITYRNHFCAKCHGVSDGVQWKVHFDYSNLPEAFGSGQAVNFDLISLQPWRVSIALPKGHVPRPCVLPATCLSTCSENQELCDSSPQSLVMSLLADRKTYRNVPCALCSGIPLDKITKKIWLLTGSHDNGLGSFAFSALVQVEGLQIDVVSSDERATSVVKCSESSKKCQVVSCVEGFDMLYGKCVKVQGRVWKISFNLNGNKKLRDVFSNVKADVSNTVSSAYSTHGSVRYWIWDAKGLAFPSTDVSSLWEQVVDTSFRPNYNNGRNGEKQSCPIELTEFLVSSWSSSVSVLYIGVTIPESVITAEEKDVYNNVVPSLSKSLQEISVIKVEMFNSSVDNFKACNITGNPLSSESPNSQTSVPLLTIVEGYLSLILLSISSVFLIVRIVCQYILKELRKPIGNLQFIMCICLLSFYICFIIAASLITSTKNETTISASVFAASAHFFRLCVFCCSNAIAWHMYGVFSESFVKASGGGTTLYVKVVVHTVTAPLVILACALAFQFVEAVPQYLRPEYGLAPWIAPKLWPQVVLFFVPAGIVLLLNIILFIVIAIKIRRSTMRGNRVLRNKASHQRELRVYLILATLLGLGWIFAIMAITLQEPIANLIFTIILSLEGVFLALATLINTTAASNVRSRLSRSSRTKSSFLSGSTRSTSGGHREPSSAQPLMNRGSQKKANGSEDCTDPMLDSSRGTAV